MGQKYKEIFIIIFYVEPLNEEKFFIFIFSKSYEDQYFLNAIYINYFLIVHSYAYIYVMNMFWHKVLLLQNQNIFIIVSKN